MAKYSKEITEKICNAIRERKGRVIACEEAGISYQAFLNWMGDDRKVEFVEAIKKAESDASQSGKEYAAMKVFQHMDKHWQAAAWWLERRYPSEFRNVQENKDQVDLNIAHDIKGKKEDV